MALLKISYKSAELGTKTGINVILPEKRLKDEPLPVLYLLHGYTDNETSWCSQTSLERYVRYKNIAVVMPNAFNSFYTDMACGVYNFYTYFICELIPFCRENFNVSPRREDNFIAGLFLFRLLKAPPRALLLLLFALPAAVHWRLSFFSSFQVFLFPLQALT
jgi:putative tributyrin esterase